jgi:hypothetical protein
MKSQNLLIPIFFLVFALLTGCNDSPPEPTGPVEIGKVIPVELLDSLRKKGMVIHEGQQPPVVEGIFNMSPVIVTANTGPGDQIQVGRVIADYRFEFSGQNTANNTVTMRYKSLPSQDQAKGTGVYISGSGSGFTLYAESSGRDQGIDYVSVIVLSGEISDAGTKNMQLAFFYKSKGSDPGNKLLKVGQIRIFADRDKISKATDNYRMADEEVLGTLHSLGTIL